MFKSRVNQPTRCFLNSNDDTTASADGTFSSFEINLQTPILNAKKLQLVRATIPNAQVNIPDYALMFWYRKTNTLDLSGEDLNDATLYCVRLYPSDFVPPTGFTTYVKNRIFTDPSDLVSALNVAAAAGGDSIVFNPYWAVNDVTFSYDTVTRQISMTGADPTKYYSIAGWNDPFVLDAQRGTGNKGPITLRNFNGATTRLQPSIPQYTLNLRVGYALSGQVNVGQVTPTRLAHANLTNTAFAGGVAIPPDSYPNLVYSGSVYLYSDVVAGSSVSSNQSHNLLSVVPSNAPQLGVIQYVAATLTWLDKIPDTIYQFRIQMYDDNNQPFALPDNAVVNVELGISYD